MTGWWVTAFCLMMPDTAEKLMWKARSGNHTMMAGGDEPIALRKAQEGKRVVCCKKGGIVLGRGGVN